MNRTTLSLIAGTTALVAITGVAALTAPDGSADDTAPAARRPVERSSLLCPSPSTSDLAETSYTSYTPVTKEAGTSGKGELVPASSSTGDDGSDPGKKAGADEKDAKDAKGGEGKGESGDGGGASDKAASPQSEKPVLTAKDQGKPVTADESGADGPALIGAADGGLAPGWTVQQTTEVDAGSGRGLLGVNCSAPGTDFWFPGASTADDRDDYVHLTNPDDTAAVVDIELYGKDGAIKSDVGEGIQVRPHQSVPVLLSTLTEDPETNLTVHVSVRSGRVAAAVRCADGNLGSDWLPASVSSDRALVLPGIPKDATSVRLVAFTPGGSDADLKIQLASPTGLITPAGHESLHVKAGMTAAVDLGDVTRGEAGSLVLTPQGGGTVVAAARVVRGKGDKQESAFVPATGAVGSRATAADNRAKGSTLDLTAPSGAARVRVTASAGSEGGTPVSKEYSVKAGTTLGVTPPTPSGLKGTYALTVEQLSGSVFASRLLEAPSGGVPMFTVQTLPYDAGTVEVPATSQDLSVLQD